MLLTQAISKHRSIRIVFEPPLGAEFFRVFPDCWIHVTAPGVQKVNSSFRDNNPLVCHVLDGHSRQGQSEYSVVSFDDNLSVYFLIIAGEGDSPQTLADQGDNI